MSWNHLKLYETCLNALSGDERITVWHIAVLVGILQLATNTNENPIYISRKKVMQFGHIRNIVTYHKYIKELQLFGYIDYVPSHHPGRRSKVYLQKSLF